MKNIIFISKDALCKKSLPIYGNSFWKTPNIDDLAKKGTVFNRHYTAGGSTAMAFTSLALMKYCHESGRRDYKSETSLNGNTLFDKLYEDGYDCHIIWDDTYQPFANKHFLCEGEHTKIHNLHQIKQINTTHINGQFDDVSWDESESDKAIDLIREELTSIKTNSKRNYFIWMHLPHVLRGRQGYGSDIDLFDKIIGVARKLFGDENIFISADHGHMNGNKNKYHYGFDVGEGVACIPLICPKINNLQKIDFPTSTIQMYDIFMNHHVSKLEYVVACDTAYFAQPNRKIAIIKDNYKYCFDKKTKKEYLYDVVFDEHEDHNLVFPEFFDIDRHLWYSTAQCFYYPDWHNAKEAFDYLKKIKNSLWKKGNAFEEAVNNFYDFIRRIRAKIRLRKPNKNICNNGK